MYDVTVVGGGFAGVTAARDLRHAGRSVLLLEASHRLGGRTFVRRFAGTSLMLDFGGTWVLPATNPAVMEELARYGISTDPTPMPEHFANLLGDEVMTAPSPDQGDLEPLYEAIRNLGASSQDPPSSLDEVISALPDPARAWAQGYVRYLAGCTESELDPYRWTDVSPEDLADVDHYSHKIEGGTRHLIDAIAADSPFEVRFGALVTSVDQAGEHVVVQCQGGPEVTSRLAVIAVPVNVWQSINFAPELSAPKVAMSTERHAGHSVKLWIIAAGVPENFRGLSSTGPISYLRTERSWPDGRCLLVAFGQDMSFRVGDLSDVQTAIRRFVPGAVVVEVDSHDWNHDPLALGTWFSFRPGQARRFRGRLQTREGRLFFAGGDLSEEHRGTIEGAVASGRLTAREALAR